jgi:c-di-GMP-binding flagellar brake protein YcgR
MSDDFRRAKRRRASQTIEVRDTMAEQSIGRVGNLSETGMLMLSTVELTDDALYQLSFHLVDDKGLRHEIEIGAHQLWSDAANVAGHYWCGFRFIEISPEGLRRLRSWIEEPGGEYV